MRPLFALALTVLLAGCVAVEEDPDDGREDDADGVTTTRTSGPSPSDGSAPQQGTARGSANGIDVEVAWRTCDAGYCANATATNRGSATVQVASICDSPWTDRMTHDGRALQHREPYATCAAYGRKPFGPGDRSQVDLVWDGDLHEDERASPAPAGSYTWTIVFWWDDAQGGPRQEAKADVRLVVGAD